MKNHFTKTIVAIATTLILFSCSKDDDRPNYSEENFMTGFLTSSGFSASTDASINGGSYEFGTEFTPLVKGKITSLKVKPPATNGALRITIWDKSTATATVIRSETVNVTAANTEQGFDIVDLELTANHQYAITMNSDDWYNHRRTGNTDVTYPITSGNIRIDNYKWIGGTTQSYPTNIALSYYAGDVSFNFIQID
jgi:hypothetical protein